MRNRQARWSARGQARWAAAPLTVAVAATLLAGCGSDDGEAAGKGEPIVMGMSDDIISTDPASGYDPASWLVFNNVFQSLLSFPKGSTTPQPEAASQCGFTDSRTRVYSCTLRDGLRFSNGNELTSEDVKFSFERTLRIDDEAGPAVMLDSIDEVTTTDKKTVVFRLKYPDATFPQKIASGAGSIVDHRSYPKNSLREDQKAVGSGVYTLSSFDKKQARFSVNPHYRGPAEAQNSGMTLKLFHGDQDRLKKAVQKGDVDLAYRGLSTAALAGLEASSGTAGSNRHIQVVEGTSAEVQHLVFNLKDPVTGKLGVRQAIAYLLDRTTLIRDVYKRTAEPLYSVVPAGITGHNTAFFDRYGERPQRDKAEAALRSEGIQGKAELTLWATPVRYGPDTVKEFEEIADQLNASGLFDAKVKTRDIEQYDKDIAAGKYGVYVKGWVPDYPDADNFTAPFFGEGNVLSNGYDPGRITGQLLPRTAKKSNRADTVQDFEAVQDQVAEEVPVLPVWQGKQYAVARENIAGLEWTLDASTVFRFWEISKGADG
ncbi:ABC transporter substrate-binding protein [Streptomyces daliensis]